MASTTSKCRDPNTLSNYNEFRTTHTVARFNIDFANSKLAGDVVLTLLAVRESDTKKIVLDTSYLDVKDVEIGGSSAKWNLKPRSEPYGSALEIEAGDVEPGKSLEVAIRVETTQQCTALQWLTPAQTSNKKHPYMFSQCQAIHARSVFPCQDTPDVKSTFDFYLRSPLPVIASGLSTGVTDFQPGQDSSPGTLRYSFHQPNPIPSYLFAIASGDIAMASIGPRSLVATGPEELTGAKWELETDMERFIETAEGILQTIPYAWTTYNVLVLPPSFPYGGMENPQFTFATPTIISGDRENVDVIAHELSHQWSGNLVSNASWEHFWLNEGWTTYLERRIQAVIHGEPARSFSAIIGWKALSDSIAQFGADSEFTKLVVDLKGKDPDDAFSSVPYEKGFNFLYHLETLLGKAKWDAFIPHYFTKYARKSVDSFEFKDTLCNFFANDEAAAKLLIDLDWHTWFYAPGFPPKPAFDTSLADVCYALAAKWETLLSNFAASGGTSFTPHAKDLEGWSANQIVVFLEKVQLFEKPLAKDDVQQMGQVYGLDKSQNVEIVSRYFSVGLRAKDEGVYGPTAELLGRVGRMKFVRPLYRQLNDVDRELAVKTFKEHESFYHPICRQMVQLDLFGKS